MGTGERYLTGGSSPSSLGWRGVRVINHSCAAVRVPHLHLLRSNRFSRAEDSTELNLI